MKKKAILLSTIILGGFSAPIIQTTTADADQIKTQVIQKESKATTSKNDSNQIPRPKKISLNETVALNDLDTQTSIAIPSSTKDQKHPLDDIYLNLTTTELTELKNNQTVSIKLNNLKTKSNWGGNLLYAPVNSNFELKYDNAKHILTSAQTTILFHLIDGDSLVHYVYKDTDKEHYKYNHEGVYENSSDIPSEFTIDTLRELSHRMNEELEPVGYFDAVDINFDTLPDVEPDYGNEPDFKEEKIDAKFDPDAIGKDNAEYTVYLEKAKPYNINLDIYLDGKIFKSKKLSAEINSFLDKQVEPELPDPEKTTLDLNKTAAHLSFDYFPQFGTSTSDGKLFHKRIFSNYDHTNDFWKKTLVFGIQDTDEPEGDMVPSDHAGANLLMELHYTSKDSPAQVTADVEITSNIGPQIVTDVTGKKGETITVDVPQVKGYKSDKKTVKAHVNANGTITTTEKVEYTKINEDDNDENDENSNNNEDTNNNNDNDGSGSIKPPVITPIPQPEKFNGFLGTMKKNVKLYSLNNGKFVEDKARQLSAHSDWRFDQTIKIDGNRYYRVSTNEWVKANDIYRYEVEHGIVETKDTPITTLVNSDTSRITDRGLAAKTGWKYDRIAYLGTSEEKHYRVSTREFVHTQDVDRK
ncbi:hypothetical protein [Companilactobacillus kimchiensis]|uniref:Surface layer protein A domain-containing protein n=1 Tax=Companilactobacillus kimchiensis TaxID=993692 RepID=A0A0R2LED2_9LACO|nr:hypothetical protein [Companilactobacillus kimchiensis]KRN96548.1 hypothetical protein IV57_GL001782 [Companilactobacillus kimchiensis]